MNKLNSVWLEQAREKAFSVARSMDPQTISRVRKELGRLLEKGASFHEARTVLEIWPC